MHDLILRGGHLVDPLQGIDAKRDIAFAGGKVAAIGEWLEGATNVHDVSGLYVSPGLIRQYSLRPGMTVRGKVRGEDLVSSETLKRKFREAKKRLNSESKPRED
jgi:predicted amidohydrolase